MVAQPRRFGRGDPQPAAARANPAVPSGEARRTRLRGPNRVLAWPAVVDGDCEHPARHEGVPARPACADVPSAGARRLRGGTAHLGHTGASLVVGPAGELPHRQGDAERTPAEALFEADSDQGDLGGLQPQTRRHDRDGSGARLGRLSHVRIPGRGHRREALRDRDADHPGRHLPVPSAVADACPRTKRWRRRWRPEFAHAGQPRQAPALLSGATARAPDADHPQSGPRTVG